MAQLSKALGTLPAELGFILSTHDSSQPFETPIPEESLLWLLQGPEMTYRWYTDMPDTGKTHIHIKYFKQIFPKETKLA
ncbi:hypothetical protein I79_025736 [Cricetulus griseus]|uniref:Uncharacterized protein n=1 Tax=Cricetulus griseus TaxID=10029 RepID=G3IP34_CRIGR|nr:hypothetical protein I79_025736 [Cricetulus griseus]